MNEAKPGSLGPAHEPPKILLLLNRWQCDRALPIGSQSEMESISPDPASARSLWLVSAYVLTLVLAVRYDTLSLRLDTEAMYGVYRLHSGGCSNGILRYRAL